MTTMTKDKAQKRAVRAHMDTTGERYTTARHFLLGHHRLDEEVADAAIDHEAAAEGVAPQLPEQPPAPGTSGAAATLPPRVADPGMSETSIQNATGKGWDAWFALVDAWAGTSHTHAEIARYVHETFGIDGWWAQTVTVGYERARGMRAKHERPDGFSAGVSKTFPVSVERLFAAVVYPEERQRWLGAVELRHRTSQANRSARFDVLPGSTRLAVWFVARGTEKSTVQLQHERLADAEDVARWKARWKKHLALLADSLTDEPAESD